MNLGNIEFIYLFAILPVYYLLYRYAASKKELKKNIFADAELHRVVIGQLTSINKQRNLFIPLFIIFLLLFSLLRPQWGFSWKASKRKGVDIVVTLDVSESMLAKDVPPSRLERAKRKVLDLIEGLRGDRIALVSFAGSSYVECPLTLDYESYKLFLSSVNTDSVPIRGTNIENALSKSLAVLGVSSKQEINTLKDRAIILITDGEELSGDFEKISKIAASNNIHIFILGVGTKEGSPIPTESGYKKDKTGNVVITRLNEQVLRKLADDTGGIYVQSISSDKDTDAIYSQGIKKMLKDTEFSESEAKKWNEYYQWPLLLALILIIFRQWGGSFNFRLKNNVSLFLIFILIFSFSSTAYSQTVEQLGKNAKEAFDKADYNSAKEKYSEARKKSSDDIRLLLGEASSKYRLGEFAEAQVLFSEAASKAKTDQEKAAVIYNSGNTLVMQNKFEDAIKTFEESLKLNPNDPEAKENLEYAKKKLEEQKKKQEEEKKKENKQNQNKEDKKEENKEEKKKNENPEESPSPTPSPTATPDSSSSPTASPSPEQTPNNESEKGNQEKDKKEQEEKDQQAGLKSEENEEKKQVPEKQFDQLLDSIDEKSENRLKYRYQKAVEDLRRNREKIPEKDW